MLSHLLHPNVDNAGLNDSLHGRRSALLEGGQLLRDVAGPCLRQHPRLVRLLSSRT